MPSFDLKVLIALSDTEIADNVCDILMCRGVTNIFRVESTQHAIDAMLETQFDLFIIDARVPVMLGRSAILYGGIDYIRFIRMCAGKVSEATVVFLRSRAGMQDVLESHAEILSARDAGASCILAHPFNIEKFDAEVKPLIDQPRPFIRAHHYTGPCRRVRPSAVKRERRFMLKQAE